MGAAHAESVQVIWGRVKIEGTGETYLEWDNVLAFEVVQKPLRSKSFASIVSLVGLCHGSSIIVIAV